MENWKPILGYEGIYETSDCGRIALRGQGYRVEVCEGWEQAQDVICEYLMEGKENGNKADSV